MFQKQNLNLLETQNCVFLVLRVQRFSFPKHLTQSSVVLKIKNKNKEQIIFHCVHLCCLC